MRKGFANLLYLVFGLPLTLAAFLGLAMRPWVLDRNFYKKFVTDDRLYAALQSPETAEGAEPRLEIDGSTFDGPLLVKAIQPRLPVAEIKAFGTQAIDRVFDSLERAGGPTGFVVDAAPLKSALRAVAPAIATDYVNSLPVRDEVPAEGDYTFRPASSSPTSTANAAGTALVRKTEAIPAQLENKQLSVESGLPMAGSVKSAFMNATLVISILALVLIVGLALLPGGGAGLILSRLGSYLLPPAVVTLAIGLFFSIPNSVFLEKIIHMPPEIRSVMTSGVGASLRGYLSSVLATMSRSFFFTGLIGVSVGAVLKKTMHRIFEPKEV